ncbi:MAG: glycosyltransferase family 1 protein [Candidatus Methylacidiphilales bacterium]|nr:glycosyltransferase family 1 protein [Candidatus Methylacidiphilales bacterium]
MKIALVTETFPPEVNGVAMTLQRLCREWIRRGFAVQVVHPRQPRETNAAANTPWQALRVSGAPIPGYPEARVGAWSQRLLKRAWSLQRPDYVHVATEGVLGWSALAAARSLDIPLVTSFHTNFHDYARHYGAAPLKPLVARYLRSFHNRGRLCLVPDDALRAELEQLGIRRTARMGRGVDTSLFDPARRDPALRREWGAEDGDPVFIHVSRVAAEKNIPLVIEAFRAVQSREPRARLIFVGDGPIRPRLERTSPGVRFVGMRFDEDLARHYASADVFLFASETETYGNVVMEALASGLAVLTYDYASARQHIRDGINGRVVPKGDGRAFIAAAEAMLAERESWAGLGVAGRETAQRLPWRKIVDDYLAEVRSALPLTGSSAVGLEMALEEDRA